MSNCLCFRLVRQPPVGLVVLGHDEQAGRVLVQPVNNPRAQGASDALKVVAQRHERVGEGPVGMAGSGMDREPGRLVDDDDVAVLVDHVQRVGLGL